jgi:hypothetical protein
LYFRVNLSVVIAGLDPAIHDDARRKCPYVRLSLLPLIMDARVKPAHDEQVAEAE